MDSLTEICQFLKSKHYIHCQRIYFLATWNIWFGWQINNNFFNDVHLKVFFETILWMFSFCVALVDHALVVIFSSWKVCNFTSNLTKLPAAHSSKLGLFLYPALTSFLQQEILSCFDVMMIFDEVPVDNSLLSIYIFNGIS